MLTDTKRKLKQYKNSENIIIRLSASGLHKIWRNVRLLKDLITDANSRSVFLLKLQNSGNVHQTSSVTYMNRYPHIFSACRKYLGEKNDLKILSYGCSTGEEVLTLRQYFPDAQITGAEINRRSLAVCRKLPADRKISFIYSEFSEIASRGKFDAIFCMAVFQRTPRLVEDDDIQNLRNIYPFEKFDRQLDELDKILHPQGLLIIKFAQYSFLETFVASKYKPLNDDEEKTAYISSVFKKDGNLASRSQSQNTIFIKLRD